MTITMLEFVQRRLANTPETYRALQEGSGVSKSAIQRIATGETKNPPYSQVQALYDYFRREEVA